MKVREPRAARRSSIRADNVINATGVWADQIRPEELHSRGRGAEDRAQPRDARARGPRGPAARRRRDRSGGRGPVDLRAALARAQPARDDRQQLRRATIDHVRPSAEDVEYLLDGHQRVLRHEPRCRDDLAGAYAGVRPLISTGDTRKSVDISRKAELYETSSGLITITGGKLTTWRRMAKMAVDRAGRARRTRRSVPHPRRFRSGSRSTRRR